MAVTAASSAPYAPPTAVLEIIDRHRRGVSGPFDATTLARIGISDSLIPRTLQAIQTLDLVNDEGVPTQTMEGLRRATDGEFKSRLAAWLNGAYADVMQFVDPATASDTAVRDAFRPYNPVGQQPRMVTLFTGLYAAAGVRNSDRAITTSSRPARAAPVKARTVSTPASKTKAWKPTDREQAHRQAGIPDPLAGLLASLPQKGKGWTRERREAFVKLFGQTLNFCIPIVSKDESETGEADA